MWIFIFEQKQIRKFFFIGIICSLLCYICTNYRKYLVVWNHFFLCKIVLITVAYCDLDPKALSVGLETRLTSASWAQGLMLCQRMGIILINIDGSLHYTVLYILSDHCYSYDDPDSCKEESQYDFTLIIIGTKR